MHIIKRLFVVLCLIGLVFVGFNSQPVYAADDIVETNFFGNIQDDNEGCGVFMIVNLVVDILSMGVVIAGVIGVTVAGITYMSAKDSEEKTRKAKNRILEIVIGLVVYAVLYVGVQWLLPGGKANSSCQTLTDEQVVSIREKEKAEKEKAEKTEAEKEKTETEKKENESTNNTTPSSDQDSSYKGTQSYRTCMKKALFKSESVRDQICKLKKTSDRIAKTAELLAAPSKSASRQCYPLTRRFSKWSQFKRCAPTKNYQYAYDKFKPDHWKRYSDSVKNLFQTGASCDIFVSVVVRASGYDNIGLTHDPEEAYLAKAKKKWKKVSKPSRGDVCISGGHVKIYLGNKKIAEASSGIKSGDKRWGGVTKGNCKGFKVYHAIK